ncbi:sphingomyelin synthase-like protein [Fadolivirus algeromassiliense]|jgi:hypothetical protein|uniref:Sphingomyelin synthase-like protein n=1 Tax=Fadolivirus FV1/VV64 TaxID=3070911 RepID=A0A7D3UVM9_9VIRU|nr:sphingomyelin synthase-like protein [Fadolivirus algeromassiliense]QKF94174.1 sphingomyelin synthase-like protein [Fadolivirus FV1/VV64]
MESKCDAYDWFGDDWEEDIDELYEDTEAISARKDRITQIIMIILQMVGLWHMSGETCIITDPISAGCAVDLRTFVDSYLETLESLVKDKNDPDVLTTLKELMTDDIETKVQVALDRKSEDEKSKSNKDKKSKPKKNKSVDLVKLDFSECGYLQHFFVVDNQVHFKITFLSEKASDQFMFLSNKKGCILSHKEICQGETDEQEQARKELEMFTTSVSPVKKLQDINVAKAILFRKKK